MAPLRAEESQEAAQDLPNRAAYVGRRRLDLGDSTPLTFWIIEGGGDSLLAPLRAEDSQEAARCLTYLLFSG